MGASVKGGGLGKPPAVAAKPRIVYGEQLGTLEEAIQKTIALRAYEMFEAKGRAHGHDMEDWFDAEQDLIRPMNIEITDAASQIAVRAEVPGFKAADIQIGVSPRKLIIWGQTAPPGAPSVGKPLRMLAEIKLPGAVDPKRARASVSNAVLEFQAAKQAAGAA
ncbi:MAG: DUF2934 domain-containing protein [Candidatus Acidiferrales bacterium]